VGKPSPRGNPAAPAAFADMDENAIIEL